MKKSILCLFLMSLVLSAFTAGCRSEASLDEDGAKVEIEGND